MNVFTKKVLFITLCFSLSSISISHAEDLNTTIKNSKAMVDSGHAFLASLACPDSSTPFFISVGTGKNKDGGFVDVYSIGCKDGTRGQFRWDEHQAGPPPPPAGFRMKNESELNAFTIKGRVNEISVSPTGRIWLTTKKGFSYYIDDLYGIWSQGSLTANQEEYANDLGRITFFNSDIAIATGGLNGRIFRTEDAGKTWTDSKPTHSQYIYTVYATPQGKVWMGGSAGIIVFSADYGKTWKQLATKFHGDNRMASIFMMNDKVGIAGSLDGDELLTTSDNWTTSKKIPTPKSEGLISKSPRDTFRKVAMLDDELAIEQGESVFRRRGNNERSTELSKRKITRFEFDRDAKIFYFIDRSGFVYSSTGFRDLAKVSTQNISKTVIASTVANGALYLLDSDKIIYRITKDKFEKSQPYP